MKYHHLNIADNSTFDCNGYSTLKTIEPIPDFVKKYDLYRIGSTGVYIRIMDDIDSVRKQMRVAVLNPYNAKYPTVKGEIILFIDERLQENSSQWIAPAMRVP